MLEYGKAGTKASIQKIKIHAHKWKNPFRDLLLKLKTRQYLELSNGVSEVEKTQSSEYKSISNQTEIHFFI